MTGTQPFRLNGAALLADPSGALVWPEAGLLVVADLHLEKASAFARRGQLLPPYDSAATIARLLELAGQWRPRRIVCLGDSFHDRGGAERLAPEDRAGLERLAGLAELIWIEGNHDVGGLPPGLGRVLPELVQGPLVLRHEALPQLPAGEVSGHWHPKVRVRFAAGGATLRCFVTDGRRLVLPAFGAFTGGLDVGHPAFAGLFPGGFRTIALGRRRALLLDAATPQTFAK